MTAHEKLQELRDEATAGEQRRDEVRLERDRAQRAVDSAEGALADYYGKIERGEKPDAPQEKVLRAALEKARVSATLEWNARARAAAERVTEAEQAVREFIAGNVDALAAELVEEAVEARDALLVAVEALNLAEAAWNGVRRRWGPLMEHRNVATSELPSSPLAGATGAMAEAMAPLASGVPRHASRLLPIPASFLPEGERPEPVPEDGVVHERQLLGTVGDERWSVA